MAKRVVQTSTFTPTATANATTLADGTYATVIQGGTTTQRVAVSEVYLGGQAATSAPTIMLLARDSTVAATIGATTTNDTPLDAATAALASPPITGNFFTTKPQRAAANILLNLSFNAFGGVIRWLAAPGEEIYTVGNAVNLGEVSLSALTGGTPGLMGTHVVYEPF